MTATANSTQPPAKPHAIPQHGADKAHYNDAFLTKEEMFSVIRDPYVHARLEALPPEEKREKLTQFVSFVVLAKDNLELLQKMLERGFSLRNLSTHGMPYDNSPDNALSLSMSIGDHSETISQSGKNKIFDFLLEQNLDINYINKNLIGPPLFVSVYHNNLYCFEKLLSRGANIKYCMEDGDSILNFILKRKQNFSTNTVWTDMLLKYTELDFEDLNAPYNQRETVFEHFLNHYDKYTFDKILQNIQSASTLLKLSPPVNQL